MVLEYLHFFQVNVACLILSKDVIKSTAIRDTWGSHCNSLKFVSAKKLKIDQEWRKKKGLEVKKINHCTATQF